MCSPTTTSVIANAASTTSPTTHPGDHHTVNPDERVRALNQAWVHVWWIIDPEHDRWTKALAVLADTDARVVIAAGSGDNLGRRAVGQHSDPTLAAAASRIDAGITGQRTTRELRARIADIAESMRFVRGTLAGVIWLGPGSLEAITQDLDWCTTVPHSVGAWVSDDPELIAQVDHACDHVAREAVLLSGQVRQVLASGVREKPAIEQPKRQNCVSCRRWGLDVDVVSRSMCTNCLSFRKNHKVMPTEAICRLWHNGSKRVTPSLIAEAKAVAQGRKRRTG